MRSSWGLLIPLLLTACTPAMTAAEKYAGILDPATFWIHAIEMQEPYDHRFCMAEYLVASASPELETAVDTFLQDKTDTNFHLLAMRYEIETASPAFANGYYRSCMGGKIDAYADLPDLKMSW